MQAGEHTSRRNATTRLSSHSFAEYNPGILRNSWHDTTHLPSPSAGNPFSPHLYINRFVFTKQTLALHHDHALDEYGPRQTQGL
jgi:hypothetical protein